MNFFQIHDTIVDYGSQRVGLNITAAPRAFALLEFNGLESNTFTKDTTLTGNVTIALVKPKGEIGISGNLNIREGAAVDIYQDEQIANHVRVVLSSRGDASTLRFRWSSIDKRTFTETLHELVIEGNGAIDFGSRDGSLHEARFFYLDDLIIGDRSTLQVIDWQDGHDHLLVRKDSVHLEDALKKIKFMGYDHNKLQKGDYDSNFWEITPFPEPATYGSLFMAGTVSLSLLRRRQKARLGSSPS